MNNRLLDQTEGQFVISYELICLLEWLIRHHSKDLQLLIAKATQNGLIQKIRSKQGNQQAIAQDSHEIILDFFDTLEDTLYNATTDELAKQIQAQNLLPALEHIDGTFCDEQTMKSTLENVTQEIEKNPTVNAKEKLLQELLRQWNPDKNQATN